MESTTKELKRKEYEEKTSRVRIDKDLYIKLTALKKKLGDIPLSLVIETLYSDYIKDNNLEQEDKVNRPPCCEVIKRLINSGLLDPGIVNLILSQINQSNSVTSDSETSNAMLSNQLSAYLPQQNQFQLQQLQPLYYPQQNQMGQMNQLDPIGQFNQLNQIEQMDLSNQQNNNDLYHNYITPSY